MSINLHRPPHHRISASVSWIWARDDAWNNERLEEELGLLVEVDDLGNEISTASEAHPWRRWAGGESRFDLDASMSVPSKLQTEDRPAAVVTIRDYIQGTPTIFEIKHLGPRVSNAVRSSLDDPSALFDAIAHGLVSIREGEDGDEVELERDRKGLITPEALELLWYADQGPALVTALGSAIVSLHPPVGSAEKKR